MVSRTTDLDEVTIESIAALINHELRTPMGVILGAAALLEQELGGMGLTEGSQELLQLLQKSVGRLEDAVEALVLFGQLARSPLEFFPLKRAPIPVNDLLQQVAVPFLPLVREKGLHLQMALDLLLPPYPGDPAGLEGVFRQLFSNALKFTPPGGHITVASACQASTIRVSFADTGTGISAGHLHRICEPFFQSEHYMHRRYEGLGLGLTSVHRLLSLMGGQLQVDSVLGQGSRFTVVLPLSPSRPATEALYCLTAEGIGEQEGERPPFSPQSLTGGGRLVERQEADA